MAKKKSNKQSVPQSPEKFLKEKANKLPVYKCLISKNYKEAGEIIVSISRVRGNGKLCAANFKVDLWCTGIKEIFGNVNLEKENYENFIENNSDILEECDYNLAHNIIYGAVEFAEEADIEQPHSFRVWKYLLAEDNDDVPLIEFEFGKDGKYLLVTEAGSKEAKLIPKLKEKLGDDFDFILGVMPYDLDESEEKMQKEEEERFHYDYPEYPADPQLNHPFIRDILMDKNNLEGVPEKEVNTILSLPEDEVAGDILSLILWQIGETYPLINKDKNWIPDNTLIMSSLLLLAIMERKEGFTAAMEILHNTSDFQYAHLDVEASEYLLPALLAARPEKKQIEEIRKFLNEKGHPSDSHIIISEFLTGMVEKYPEMKEEVMSILHDYLEKMPQRLEDGDWFNNEVPAFFISTVLDLNDTIILPVIEKIYETGKVDSSICGDLDDVKAELSMPYSGGSVSRVSSKETLMKYLKA